MLLCSDIVISDLKQTGKGNYAEPGTSIHFFSRLIYLTTLFKKKKKKSLPLQTCHRKYSTIFIAAKNFLLTGGVMLLNCFPTTQGLTENIQLLRFLCFSSEEKAGIFLLL